MREIKFRALVKPIPRFANRQVGFMIDVSEIDFNEKYVANDDGTVYYFDEIELLQHTGLKDKYGTEIYDGDYIRCSTRTINGSVYTHVCRVFQYESGTWGIEGYHEDNHSYKTKGTVYAAHLICEVIGNIYENPELEK